MSSEHDRSDAAFNQAWKLCGALNQGPPATYGKNLARQYFDAGRHFEAARLEKRYALLPVTLTYTVGDGDAAQTFALDAWRLTGPNIHAEIIAMGEDGRIKLLRKAEKMNRALDRGEEVLVDQNGDWRTASPPPLPRPQAVSDPTNITSD